MNLQQLTDTQLIQSINSLGAEILATSADEQPGFDRLCDAYDVAQAELESRGLW